MRSTICFLAIEEKWKGEFSREKRETMSVPERETLALL
jgi:hypothetical protein